MSPDESYQLARIEQLLGCPRPVASAIWREARAIFLLAGEDVDSVPPYRWAGVVMQAKRRVDRNEYGFPLDMTGDA